jgi:hypothetical protein
MASITSLIAGVCWVKPQNQRAINSKSGDKINIFK